MGTNVMTSTGGVTGSEEGHAGKALAVFRGIPYAEPPAGPRRWQPPEPRRPWVGTFDARQFGPSAPQSAGMTTALPETALATGATDEAGCLTLNVWSPAGAADRPVMVWIHGGSFVGGGTAVPSYDASTLAAEGDVVVVSVNYRVGALGFAPVAGHANIGLLDQLLALRWIRDNIAEFGGDPESVTVFGESAGGGSILHLLAGPRAAGLCRRAIVQSGATDLTLSADGAVEIADRIRAALGTDDVTGVPIEAVIDAQTRVLSDVIATMGMMPYHPSVDGDVVVAPPTVSRSSGEIDLLIGTTADEMTLFLDPATWTLTDERLGKRARRYLAGYGVSGAAADGLLAAYDGTGTASQRWSALRGDAEMWVPFLSILDLRSGLDVRGGVDSHGGAAGRTFAYRFDWPAAPPNAHLGACHAIDIPFTFSTLDRCGWDAFVGLDTDAIALSWSLRQAWVAFAATGQPATDALGPWPSYSQETRATMLLGRESSLAEDPRGTIRRAWVAARFVTSVTTTT